MDSAERLTGRGDGRGSIEFPHKPPACCTRVGIIFPELPSLCIIFSIPEKKVLKVFDHMTDSLGASEANRADLSAARR